MPKSLNRTAAGVVLVGGVLLARLVNHQATVFGFYRSGTASTAVAENDLIYISDTIACEDLHYHSSSNTLFAACDDSVQSRMDWFPGMGHTDHPELAGTGSFHTIDATTKESQRLQFENFNGPFVTHGIDVISDPIKHDAVYLFAINHLPNPLRKTNDTEPRARSQVEIFYHTLGTKTVQHVRSVRHPMIRTPNDVIATSPSTLYVTNDHYYREGGMRALEDLLPIAAWTDTVHITLSALKGVAPEAHVEAKVAIDTLHNNNGIGHGPRLSETTEEIMIASAASGKLHLVTVDDTNYPSLIKHKTISFDNTLDNPYYFHDPHASEGKDLSGYVLGGLSQAHKLAKLEDDHDLKLSSTVHFVSRSANGKLGEPKVIFEDTGDRVNMLTTAILTPIDSGKREAWLWATGLIGESIVAVRVEL